MRQDSPLEPGPRLVCDQVAGPGMQERAFLAAAMEQRQAARTVRARRGVPEMEKVPFRKEDTTETSASPARWLFCCLDREFAQIHAQVDAFAGTGQCK